MGIEARLRKEKFKTRVAGARQRLRQDVAVEIDKAKLDPAENRTPGDTEVVARAGKESLTWGEAKHWLAGAQDSSSLQARLDAVNKAIDNRISVQKARKEGLERSPVYLARVGEFRKVRLINLRRSQLAREMDPDDAQLRAYFKQHRDRIRVPEMRKVQMVVLKTKAEAESVKKKIQAGDITIFQAAVQYSIDPNAGRNLGEIGWVREGSGFPALDKFTFALEPDELGGPVQSPAGWHLVKVLDVRPAAFDNIDDKDTRRKTRRVMVEDRQNQYLVNLRKKVFPVTVYEDVLDDLIEREAARVQPKKDDPPATKQAALQPSSRPIGQ